MIKTIVSLFAIYQASFGNRLLLQQFPWEQPGANPGVVAQVVPPPPPAQVNPNVITPGIPPPPPPGPITQLQPVPEPLAPAAPLPAPPQVPVPPPATAVPPATVFPWDTLQAAPQPMPAIPVAPQPVVPAPPVVQPAIPAAQPQPQPQPQPEPVNVNPGGFPWAAQPQPVSPVAPQPQVPAPPVVQPAAPQPQQPVVIPSLPQQPAVPQQPGTGFPWPQQPAAPVAPQPAVPVAQPVVPAPPLPAAPVNPWGQPVAPVNPATPWASGPQPNMFNKLECKLSPKWHPNPTATPPILPDPASCAYNTKTVMNPSDNYEVLCSAPGGCYQSTININLTPTGFPIDRLKGVWCVHEGACMGATINIYNQRGYQIEMDEIKCVKPNSCRNTKFIFGPGIFIDQGHFHCDFGACEGCTINNVPCVQYVEPI